MLLHDVVEKDTLLSKLELPGSILITTADPNKSGKPGRSGGWVDLKEKVITRGGRCNQIWLREKKENHRYNRKRESEGRTDEVKRKIQVCKKRQERNYR